MAPPINPAYLELRYSGGASNNTPSLSVGGVMSSYRISSKTASTTITGVTIEDAPGSAVGAGTLAYNATAHTLTWTPNGGTAGPAVTVNGSDGKYTLTGTNSGGTSGGAMLFVNVTNASLPGGNATDSAVNVVALANKLFADVTKSQSLAGIVHYVGFYLINNHPTDDLVVLNGYIKTQPPAGDLWDLGVDPAGIGNGSTTGVMATTVDNLTAPTGVTFTRPVSSAAPLAIATQLLAGQSVGVWGRRTVPAYPGTTSNSNDASQLTWTAGY